MSTDLTDLVAAQNAYLAAMSSIVTIDDPNLSSHGVVEKRRATIDAAQSALSAHLPAEQAMPSRAPALDALRPQTGDDVAVQDREWAKVEALRASGRRLEHIIASADRPRLAAIADSIETLPEVLGTPAGKAIAAELRDVVFSRLVALGDDQAVTIAEQEAATAPVIAARTYIADTIANGAPRYDGLEAVYKVDPTTYGMLRDSAEQHDTKAIERTVKSTRVAIERESLG